MHKETLDYLLSINRSIRDAISAVESIDDKDVNGTFLDTLHALRNEDLPGDLESTIEKGDFDIPKLDFMLDGKNEFDGHPKIFLGKLAYIVQLYASDVFDGDPRLDLRIMEVLFEAGRHFERLKTYGYRWSDKQRKSGSIRWKTSPDDEVFLAAYRNAEKRRKHAQGYMNREKMVLEELEAMGYRISQKTYYNTQKRLKAEERIP